MKPLKNKKIILISIGSLFLTAASLLSLYIAAHVLQNVFLDFHSVIVIVFFIVVPSLIGTLFITLGLDKVNRRRFIKAVEIFLFTTYLLLVFLILLGGFRLRLFSQRISFLQYVKFNCNLIPFKTISTYIGDYIHHTINRNIITDNLFGNLLMFMPMGLFLPCLSKWYHKYVRYLITISIILIGVELLQLILQLGSFDVDDIILNFTGAILVYTLIRIKKVSAALKKIYLID